MGNLLMKISVPLDKDCFIEMECDFCKNRFMLHRDVYESEENISFFCPICGLPNKINTYLFVCYYWRFSFFLLFRD